MNAWTPAANAFTHAPTVTASVFTVFRSISTDPLDAVAAPFVGEEPAGLKSGRYWWR